MLSVSSRSVFYQTRYSHNRRMTRGASKLQLIFRSSRSLVTSKNLLLIAGGTSVTQPVLSKDFLFLRWTYSNKNVKHFSTTSRRHVIFTSNEPDIDIKKEPLSEYLFTRMQGFGNKTALLDFVTGQTYSYAELNTSIIKVASALNKLGYKKGDTIAIFAANCPEFIIFMLACVASGIVLTTANSNYTSGELSRQLIHSNSCALTVHQSLIKTAKHAINSEKNLQSTIKDVFVIGEAEGCRPFSQLLEDDGKSFPENVDLDPAQDTALMPYSSGTTGLPKGVMLTHMYVVSHMQQVRPGLNISPNDTGLGLLPFFHIAGMVFVSVGVLQDGGKLVTIPKFEPEIFLKALMTHKVTQLHAVPPMVTFMAKHPAVSNFDLSSLKRVVCGAAPLGLSITTEFMERLKIPLTQAYGLTEMSPTVAIDKIPPTFGSAGFLLPNTLAKVVCSESDRELGAGETGELCFKGPQVMKGYFNNENATKDIIRDGWLHSGDIGHVDQEGRLFVTDRLKELIKFKGYQVAPAELEDLLLKHPDVQDAAVIGVPDDIAGEVPRAYVVPRTSSEVNSENILQFVKDNVAPYKRLRGGVEFLEEIPKSPSGKILRRILRDRLA